MATERIGDEKAKTQPRRQMENTPARSERQLPTPDRLAGPLTAETLNQLHQTVGNTAVQRLLAQRSPTGPTELNEETSSAINSRLGQGTALDRGIGQKAGATMGADFNDVTVHHDADADQLSSQLGAKAFTVGSDIFFREGMYNPASHEGQHLIAHELTHVVQQGGSPANIQGKMSVNDPNDQYEAEADQMAAQVMRRPAAGSEAVHLQEDEALLQMQEEEEELAQMQELDEEEEELQT